MQGLKTLQLVLLGSIPVLAMHRDRLVIWRAPTLPINTPVEFTGIVFFPVDYAIAALLGVGLLIWLLDPASIFDFFETVKQALAKHGGTLWIGLVVWMGIGAMGAYQPALARYATLHTAACLIMSFWVADTVRKKHQVAILAVAVTGMTLHSSLAIAQSIHGRELGLSWLGEAASVVRTQPFRAYGLTDNPNSLGGYLVVALFACLVLFYKTGLHPDWKTGLAILAILLVSTGLIATFSRGAIGAAALALIPIGIVGSRQYRRLSIRRIAIVAGLALLILTAALVLFGAQFRSRLNELVDSERQQPEGYFLNRNFYVTDTNAAIAESRLVGLGANNLMVTIARLKPEAHGVRYPVHNVYWLIRAELGWFGMLLFVAACGFTLRGVWSFSLSPLFIWSCCFLAIGLIMLVEFYFWASPHSKPLVFFALGMVWGTSEERR